MKLGKESLITLTVIMAVALAVVAVVLIPKQRGETADAEPVALSQSAYDSGLASLNSVCDSLLSARAEVGRQMQAIIVAKGNDDAAIDTDPEWRRLKDLLARLDAEYESVRVDIINFRKTRVVTDANNEEGIPQ